MARAIIRSKRLFSCHNQNLPRPTRRRDQNKIFEGANLFNTSLVHEVQLLSSRHTNFFLFSFLFFSTHLLSQMTGFSSAGTRTTLKDLAFSKHPMSKKAGFCPTGTQCQNKNSESSSTVFIRSVDFIFSADS